ncbi:hypothetical protein [Deinococcus sp. JMULE3]|uniref:hypothetical protein n=1 Tax=Deinococcus sp. JMULE3 TaxID=2518341 RepID=UPI0020C7343A|nr:hypothetical protein [Deinococcus sp. JMULE3]
MRLGRHTLGRWNLLVLLGSALVTTALGLATQPLAAQTTTAAASAYRQGQFQQAERLLAGVADEGLLVDADALVIRGGSRATRPGSSRRPGRTSRRSWTAAPATRTPGTGWRSWRGRRAAPPRP